MAKIQSNPGASATAPATSTTNAAAAAASSGPIEPAYTIKERGSVSWGDFEQMRNDTSRPPQSTRPAELIIRIDIPKVAAMADVELDVAERRLILTAKSIYALTLPLPYPVDDKKGVAKYDKIQKCLNVTLPVKPPTATVPALASLSPVDPPVAAAPPALNADEPSKLTTPATSPTSGKAKIADSKKEHHQRWVSGASEEEQLSAQMLKEEIRKKAEESKLNAPNKPTASALKLESALKVPPDAPAVLTEAFVPSATFSGKREGYVFKRGEQGVGYYVDKAIVSSSAPSTTPTPPAATSTSPRTFPFESRQTVQAVAVLVQVPGIDPATVTVDFAQRLVQVRFATVENAIDFYALDLVPAGDIDDKTCKFDVVQRNMCLVLAKRMPCLWDEGEGDAQLVTSTPYSGALSTPQGVNCKETAAASSSSGGALTKEINSMEFSTAASELLFELD